MSHANKFVCDFVKLQEKSQTSTGTIYQEYLKIHRVYFSFSLFVFVFFFVLEYILSITGGK